MIIQTIAADTTWSYCIALCIRLVLAAACGAMIGYERRKSFKVAGLRTHILVCCGAALFMIVSKYAFVDLVGSHGEYLFGTTGTDPARVAAQVVCGIGFLGAGVIFKNGNSIKGLTTAAGLWMTAGVGMAIGSGMVVIGFFAAVFIAVMQLAMHRGPVGLDSYSVSNIRMIVQNGKSETNLISELTKRYKAVISSSRIVRNPDDTTEYILTLKVNGELTHEQLETIVKEHEEIVSIDIVL